MIKPNKWRAESVVQHGQKRIAIYFEKDNDLIGKIMLRPIGSGTVMLLIY